MRELDGNLELLKHQHAAWKGLHRSDEALLSAVSAQTEGSPTLASRCGVFYWHQSLRSTPSNFIEARAAAEMVRAGMARKVNRGKAIQMIDRGPTGLRGQSAVMGPNVTELSSQGSHYHQILVNAWSGQGCGKE